MDEDGMTFIRLSDCKFPLEMFCIRRDTHRWKKRRPVIQRLLISWRTLENRHKEMPVSQPREPEYKGQLASYKGRTIVTCEHGLLRSPRDVVEPLDWSWHIEQTF